MNKKFKKLKKCKNKLNTQKFKNSLLVKLIYIRDRINGLRELKIKINC